MNSDPVRYSAYQRARAIWERAQRYSEPARPDPFIPPLRSPRTWRHRLADFLARAGVRVRARFDRLLAWLRKP